MPALTTRRLPPWLELALATFGILALELAGFVARGPL